MKQVRFNEKKKRRFVRIVCCLICLCLSSALAACGEANMKQSNVFAMDTIMTLTAYGKKADQALASAESVIRSMEAQLDPELPTSTAYAINHANGASVVVSSQVAKMLSTAKTVYDQSDGALDLSIYPLIKLWGFIDGKYYVPQDVEISAEMMKFAFDKMVLTSYPATGSWSVSFPAGTELSFGAIGKGCTAENVIDAMRQAGITSGIISLGGNVQTLGLKPDGSRWSVAIQDPNNPSSYLGVVSVGEIAVVTSGTYQRYFEQNGNTYHHLLNPASGYPANNNLRSVTVICEDGTMADALSTALFVLGEGKALNYWRAYKGFEMIMVTKNNRVICTSGLIEEFTLTNENYSVSYSE
jgi:thiamine biosynthesis lipoprotein